jgi:hypothetical protein
VTTLKLEDRDHLESEGPIDLLEAGILLNVEVLAQGPLDELGEEDLSPAILI